MSDKEKLTAKEEEEPESIEVEALGEVAGKVADAGETARLKAELKAEHERFLRKCADLDNYKKRMANETFDHIKYANKELIQELLPVIDNFERALEHASEAADIETVAHGIELILSDLYTKLNRFGLEPVETEGKTFDPTIHEAIGHEQSSDVAAGTIISEYRKGFFLNERLLRPGLVVVAKEPSDEEPAEDEEKQE